MKKTKRAGLAILTVAVLCITTQALTKTNFKFRDVKAEDEYHCIADGFFHLTNSINDGFEMCFYYNEPEAITQWCRKVPGEHCWTTRMCTILVAGCTDEGPAPE